MAIYLAARTAIPGDLLEVREIEGASDWQRFRRVVLPLLVPSKVVVVAPSVVNFLKGFIVFIL